MIIKIKRVYEKKLKSDGYRILVDRLWPRGLSKSEAGMDLWLKEIAPSKELRNWYHQNPEKWDAFNKKYFSEIKNKSGVLEQIKKLAKEKGTVTLVYSSKNLIENNASALKKILILSKNN